MFCCFNKFCRQQSETVAEDIIPNLEKDVIPGQFPSLLAVRKDLVSGEISCYRDLCFMFKQKRIMNVNTNTASFENTQNRRFNIRHVKFWLSVSIMNMAYYFINHFD